MLREIISAPVNGLKALLVKGLQTLGSNPDAVTLAGLAMNIWIAWLFAEGRIVFAGWLMIISGALDVLDGALAKAAGRVTAFGGFLDSVVDRYSDLVLWLGIIIFYARIGNLFYLVLSGIALIGTLMISYTRARAENLIPSCKVGFMERPERHITLMLGAIADHLVVAVWILAITTQLDALHRILHTRRQLKQ
jgi:CDP-diacylglycerol--glycerol-3-phosphate 3-phosphatidyltransferase